MVRFQDRIERRLASRCGKDYCFGKPDPPDPPDYAAAAREQGETNLESAVATALLSNPNINTPLGSRTVSFDYGQPSMPQPSYSGTQPPPAYRAPEQQGGSNFVGLGMGSGGGYSSIPTPWGGNMNVGQYRPAQEYLPQQNQGGYQGGGITSIGGVPIPRVTIDEELTPEGQARFDQEQRIMTQLGGIAESGLDRVGGSMGQPFDLSGLPSPDSDVTGNLPGVRDLSTEGLNPYRRINLDQLSDINPLTTEGLQDVDSPTVAGREEVTQALMERQAPFLERQRQQEQEQLMMQGHNRGGAAWNAIQDDITKRETDARLASILAGGQEQSRLLGLQSSIRGQQFGERSQIADFERMLRAQGLNEQQVQAQMDAAIRGQQFGERGAMADFDERQRAARLAEQQTQYGTDTAERQRQIQEQAYLRQLPLSEINALRTGNQPMLPQFQAYQGSQVQPAPMFNAAQAQYGADLGNYNARAAQKGGMMSGLFSLGGAALGAGGAAGGFGNLFSF